VTVTMVGVVAGPDNCRRDHMSFSFLPRRLVPPTSSWPSYRWLRSIRFATTVSNLSALEKRVNGSTVKVLDASRPESLRGTTEHGIDTARHASDSSKTESYLLSLLADGATPTLHDLERLKPSEHSDPRSTEYALEYRALLDNICRSFSSDQLRSFAQKYGLRLSSKRRKMVFAEAIVEKAWRWPPLRELKRAQRDRTEAASQSMYTVTLMPICLTLRSGATHLERAFRSSRKRSVRTSPRLCLLTPVLDGSDLAQLSRKYNVHISVKPNPLAIYLEGSRESVREAERYVDGVRKAGYLSVFMFTYTHRSVGHCGRYHRHPFYTTRLTGGPSENFTPFWGLRGEYW